MRLLHVFPSFEVGGQQMRAALLANQMTAEGVHNLILSLNGDYSCSDRLLPNVSWERVEAPVCSGHLFQRLRSIREVLTAQQPDCLVTYNWGAIEWAAAHRPGLCRHIHIEDGFGPEEAERQLRRRVWFRRLVLSRHAQVVLPSRTLLKLARDVWRLPAERLSFVPNGINLSDYGKPSQADAREARSAWDLPVDKVVIGTLATLRAEKNLTRLVDAFAGLDQRVQCHLVIAGAGEELDGLRAHVAASGLSDYVTFPGFVEQPHKILPAFDIFALSSDTEQMPLSVLEAMAAGLPVASTDVGDIADMVEPAGRRFVAGQSRQSLLQSLNTLVQHKQIRAELGLANRRFAIDEYNIEKMLASYRELFIHG